MGITYVDGDATEPSGRGLKIIAHICDDTGGWGAGFAMALSRRWRAPEWDYRTAYGLELIKLGEVQFIPIDGKEILVANMVAQEGVATARRSGTFVRYDALEQCLGQVAIVAESLRASVHMPRIGTGLAGGRWEVIEPMIRRTMGRVPVTVYDWEAT